MLNQPKYTNGQNTHEVIGNRLIYFFKNGKIKAEGLFEKDQMEGEWKFYHDTGQLWQVGNFKHGKKNGSWIRYDKDDELEYHEFFEDDKIVKTKSE